MMSPAETDIQLTIGHHDYSIKQSPGLLRSNHAGGTTGAALWRAGVYCAEWLAQADNPLLRQGAFPQEISILELGAGIAGLSSLVLARRQQGNGRFIATDMSQTLKLLRENVANAFSSHDVQRGYRSGKGVKRPSHGTVEVEALDWEHDDAKSLLLSINLPTGVDLILACDCVYNYALIEPLMQTCVSVARMRESIELRGTSFATISIFVQQLRQPDIMQEWLEKSLLYFDIWRLPSNMMTGSLGNGSPFVVHLLKLKEVRHD